MKNNTQKHHYSIFSKCGYCWNSLISSSVKILGRTIKWTLYLIAFICTVLFIESSNYKLRSSPEWNSVSNLSLTSYFPNENSTIYESKMVSEGTVEISPKTGRNSTIYESGMVPERTEEISPKIGRFMTSQKDKIASSFKNPWPLQVQWLMSPPDPCASHTPFIICIIITGAKNRLRRDRVRRTWGNKGLYNVTHMRIVFLLGQTLDNALQQQLIEEQKQYNDILQYSAIDSYRNLTYKSLAGLRWIDDYCPDAPWVAKIDDDIQVNPFNLHNYLKHWLVEETKQPSLYGGMPRLIHGRLMTTGRPWRKGKYVVTKEEYPPDHYPPLVLGPAYILRSTAVVPLLTHSLNITMVWLEDVYITGMVARAAGIGHISNEKYWAPSPISQASGAQFFRHTERDETSIREEVWKAILKKKNMMHLIKSR